MRVPVIYRELCIWDKPGGNHLMKRLKCGDTVDVIEGWRYKDRKWKDKRFVKVLNGNAVGYVLAAGLAATEEENEKDNND